MSSCTRTGATALVVTVASLACLGADLGTAAAGGMYLPLRGVRSTGRAGAFIAGVDDVSALWTNPAGLAQLDGASGLVDATWVGQDVTHDRIDSGGNRDPSVSNQSPGLPVPSLGFAGHVGERLVLGGGVWAPYAALGRYDEDGPQRYASVDQSRSIIMTLGIGLAVRLGDRVRLGATLQDHVTSLSTSIMLSGCPGQTVCAPEDPEFDSFNRIDQTTMFSPSGSVGAQVDLARRATVGVAVQLPVKVSGHGTLHTRLPSSGFFDGASIEGDRADVELELPMAVRFGLEVRPGRWRVEAAGTIERWSEQDQITITPVDVRIVNAPGVGTYELGPMIIPRHYRDTFAAQLGVEGRPLRGKPLVVRAGYLFETGAPPDATLSVSTVDGTKHLGTVGAGWRTGRWSIDLAVGYGVMPKRTVDPAEAAVPQLNPIRDDSTSVYVNAGDYRASWLLAGLGATRAF
ncbi:MAG TPA: outer membrane protein transport protein [Kofleriaceae bacterium]|nr:outer membrane protein transport protein [Kofleriaceae bacterium]